MGVRAGSPESITKPVNAKDAGRRPGRNYGSVPIEQVIPDPSQPRTEFDKDALQELSASFCLLYTSPSPRD